MTYASGGKIESSDFNTRNGGTTANVSGQINCVWSTGNGNSGYGQSSPSANVSVGNKVNASNWTTFYNNINAARKHQSGGSYSNLSVPVPFNTITFNASLGSTLTDVYSNRLTSASSGSTVTGTNDVWNVTVNSGVVLDTYRSCGILFSSSDAIRYFFNAGGKITMVYTATGASTTRSAEMRDLVNNLGGFSNYAAYSNSGRTGSGGSVSKNDTNIGYYNVTNSSILDFIQVDDNTAPYAGAYAYAGHWVFGSTTNGSRGNDLRLILGLYSPVATTTLSIQVTLRCDITYPSTTYLSDSWGIPTITYF